jgi:hypothetical protein
MLAGEQADRSYKRQSMMPPAATEVYPAFCAEPTFGDIYLYCMLP